MAYTCRFCGFHGEIDEFEVDYNNNRGFWCPDCDGFSYFDPKFNNQRFLLLLESNEPTTNLPKLSRKFPSRVSPLRYPGGKSKIINQIYNKCNKDKLKNFVEPFAGGASVGLSLLLSHQVEELYLNDADYGIYSLFWSIKFFSEVLCDRIIAFIPSNLAQKASKKVITDNYTSMDLIDAGWTCLINNRLSFSGIWKANCMSNPSARWNPEELCRRIRNIHAVSEHIHLSCTDALPYIEEMYWLPDATIFIDPPYFAKGKELYHHYYSPSDHKALADLIDDLYKGMPGADMIVTYDMAEYIKSIYDYPKVELLPRKYSIAN